MPSDEAIQATAKAVATTNTVEVIRMPRRSRRMAFFDVVRLSQNSSAGRKSISTTSCGIPRCSRPGMKATRKPSSTWVRGTGSRRMGARALPATTAAPTLTTTMRPSMGFLSEALDAGRKASHNDYPG
jgi:hypothetical protein